MSKISLCLLCILLAIYSCKKSPEKDQDPSTIGVSLNVSQQGKTVTLAGQIQGVPTENIKQTGFIWAKKSDPLAAMSGVYIYNSTDVNLQFSYKALTGFSKDSTYYVKAFYVDNSNLYHYSQQFSFKSTGTAQPALKPLLKAYTWGDEVELSVDTLNISDLNSISVNINQNITIHPTRIAGTKIYFVVPSQVPGASNTLFVTIVGQASNSIGLSLNQPVITVSTDVNLIANATLTINGQFFNPVASQNIVTIGNTKLNVVSATVSKLVVDANNATISQTGALTVQTGVSLIATSSNSYSIYKFFQPKKAFPGEAREGSVAVVLNGAIFTGLGKSKATNQTLKDWWKYDPATDIWTRVADCPQRAVSVNVFSLNNKAYIGLGVFDDYRSNAFYVYNPANNTWASMHPFPGTLTVFGTSFNSAQYGYIVCGEQQNSAGFIKVNDVWKYNPANDSWQKLSPFPGTPRELANSFVLNNKGYMLGGIIQAPYSAITEAWSFDFSTETWQQVASMPFVAGSIGQFTFAINNKGYLGGGNNNDTDGISQLVYEYDPSANTWTVKENIINPINYDAASVSIGGTGYVICGWSNNFPYSEGSQSFLQFIP